MKVIKRNNIIGTYSDAEIKALEQQIEKHHETGGAVGVGCADWEIMTELKEIPTGEFFALTPKCSTVYSKDEYIREEKKYASLNNKTGEYRNLKGDSKVYIGFTY
tara:strand:+ start:226 stop:540 length:315 start_codon:yes stop_codon:yes gene_type:complete